MHHKSSDRHSYVQRYFQRVSTSIKKYDVTTSLLQHIYNHVQKNCDFGSAFDIG